MSSTIDQQNGNSPASGSKNQKHRARDKDVKYTACDRALISAAVGKTNVDFYLMDVDGAIRGIVTSVDMYFIEVKLPSGKKTWISKGAISRLEIQ